MQTMSDEEDSMDENYTAYEIKNGKIIKEKRWSVE